MGKGLINGVVFILLYNSTGKTRCGIKETMWNKRNIFKWFRSYLHDQRKQVCKINKAISNAVHINCGAPQGSNLGPLLFNLYINDLPNCLQRTSASMFADDINLSCKGQTSADIEYKLNCNLDNIQKWLISNKLTLNRTKTEFMLIGSQPRLDNIIKTPKILFGEHEIKRLRVKTVLGLIIDDQLN